MSVRAARGQVCVVETLKPAGGIDKYRLARVVKTTKEGVITHIDLHGELPRASSANTLRLHNASKSWAATGPRGERLAKGDLDFPQEWDSLEEATKWVNDWLKKNP